MVTELKIVKPYVIADFNENVKLSPNEITDSINSNILNKLKKNLEKKTNNFGYIQSVNEVLTYDNNFIDDHNLKGEVIFNVMYRAMLYNPINDTNIITIVELFYIKI